MLQLGGFIISEELVLSSQDTKSYLLYTESKSIQRIDAFCFSNFFPSFLLFVETMDDSTVTYNYSNIYICQRKNVGYTWKDVIEQFRLEGSLKAIQFQPLRAPSNVVLNALREGASMISLNNLFQYLSTFTAKNFFLYLI